MGLVCFIFLLQGPPTCTVKFLLSWASWQVASCCLPLLLPFSSSELASSVFMQVLEGLPNPFSELTWHYSRYQQRTFSSSILWPIVFASQPPFSTIWLLSLCRIYKQNTDTSASLSWIAYCQWQLHRFILKQFCSFSPNPLMSMFAVFYHSCLQPWSKVTAFACVPGSVFFIPFERKTQNCVSSQHYHIFGREGALHYLGFLFCSD